MIRSLSIESMFSESPFYERFDRVREAGFDAVEFGRWTDLDFTRVQDALARNRLTLTAFAGDDNASLTDPAAKGEFLEYLAQSIAVAKSFAAAHLFLRFAWSGSDAARSTAATRALVEAARRANKAGVTLLVKPECADSHPDTLVHATRSVGEVVRAVDSRRLRLAVDAVVYPAVGAYGASIGYIHLDAADVLGASLRLFGKSLAAKRYDGIVGLHCGPGADTAKCLEAVRNF